MKRIVFTVGGRKVGWTRLTGFLNPPSQDVGHLVLAAKTAKKMDSRVESWEIVEDGRVLASENGGGP